MMISRINGVFKVNIARKCVFPDFGGRPGGLEFQGTKILAQFTNYIFFLSDHDVSPICKRNYAKIYSTFSVRSNNVVQPPIIFTINSSYLSRVYQQSVQQVSQRQLQQVSKNVNCNKLVKRHVDTIILPRPEEQILT